MVAIPLAFGLLLAEHIDHVCLCNLTCIVCSYIYSHVNLRWVPLGFLYPLLCWSRDPAFDDIIRNVANLGYDGPGTCC